MHRFDEPHPFALETATSHYAADRPVRALHLRLEVELDFAARSLTGAVTHRLQAVRAASQVTFDAVELEITAVTVGGRAADFDADGRRCHVHLPKALQAGQRAEVRLSYRATPRRGLYFIAPDAAYPKRPLQAWTQGQDEDSRYWFPCLDAPAQKCTTEVLATFPAKLTSLSNGVLVSDAVKAGKRTRHHRLETPHSPYLVTLVVGEFEELVQPASGLRVRTLYPRGRKADALRCVKRTPQMVKLFERLSGQPYPWGDYAQIFVAEFIFGGMENTGATTLTDAVLHDERAHPDYGPDAEALISHELAHQWFGDLLTCRDWPHGWLNEGFATYAEVLWREAGDGDDEADHQRRADLEAYLSEVEGRYARPIVARNFDAPIDLFDRHLYEKGALVLHELRTRLGHEDFEKAVQHYVAAHRHGVVETVDLARAVEEVTGRNLDRFFDDYVHRAGHPQLKVEAKYDAGEQRVRLSVKQAQAGEPYHLTLRVRAEVQGKAALHAFEVSDKEHAFLLPAAREPEQLVVDGRRDLLATLEVDKPAGWWRAELARAPWARARTEAAVALGKDGSSASVEALGRALAGETGFWGTRVACAKALAAVRTPRAKALLLDALGAGHPRVRRAAVAALGDFRGDAQVQAALTRLCRQGDRSCFVEGEAARALGKLRAEGALPVLKAMLARPAFQDVVRAGALDGLAALQDPQAWPLLTAAAKYGAPPFARRTAAGAVAKLAPFAKKEREAVELLAALLRDPSFRVRLAAIDACSTLGDERLLGPLGSTPFLDGREQRLAREAVRALRAKAPPKELAALRGDLDKLKAEVKALKERLDAKRPAKAAGRRQNK